MLKFKSIKAYVEAKLGQKGAAIVEYAMLLAFVAVIAVAFLGDNSILDSINDIITNIESLLAKGANQSTASGGGQ